MPVTRPVVMVLTWTMLWLLLAACVPAGPVPVTVEWTTASEVDHAGFNLYRGDGPDGPWIKLNQNLIPPAGDPIVGGQYSYVDETAEAGRTYYYLLEDVSVGGGTTRHPPIQVVAGPAGGWTDLLWGGVAGLGLAAAILVGWGLWARWRRST
ncbi:MAG: hypothetical protein KKA73_26640 [Chloroflexi bacterium]|nr:hypothetical protein [Chloroflexota bacterium]MBU1751279.1 hypothetical protein [Chloroflexota bacterium]MBU1877538.1 hypothetical protein [Chloroflexota bacterium]